jgi:predicted acetyltransferase
VEAMISEFEYSDVAAQEDIEQLGRIIEQCFISSPGDSQIFFNRLGIENFRVIRVGKQIAGGLATIPMAQWWGSQSVPMTGIAGVGVAPEYRGTGVAIAMMEQCIKELHTKGVPISALYPATQRLYRKAGYEQGGMLCTWEVSTESIQLREQPLPILSVPPKREEFNELYQQKGKLNNGFLDRHPGLWESVFKPDQKEPVYSYLIGSANQPQGYIIFSQHRDKDGEFIRIRDWVTLTTAAAQTFWSFLAHHRSQIEYVRWRSAAIDYLSLLLPEQTAKQKSAERWMLRVIDMTKALSWRGYPLGIQTELHLEIQDDLLIENNGRFILSVANGRGEVTTGGKGELKLNIRDLAPLYTGLFTPQQLQLAGKLDAKETALQDATQIFAAFSPWMADFF